MRRFLLTVLIMAGSLGLAHGQAGVGKKFDTRDPLECNSLKKVTAGVPSSSQIKDLVTCKAEGTGGCCIYLMENVKVEIGKSRPFSSWSDVGNADIDNSQPVYPIRGTADKYQCQPPGGTPYPRRARTVRLGWRLPLRASATKPPSATGVAQ
jgi:hypothetical protein